VKTNTNAIATLGALGVALIAPAAFAFPVTTVFTDIPGACDPLAGPLHTDELGLAPPFPADETIDAFSAQTGLIACPADDPSIPNQLIRITNLTGRYFDNLWYVGEVDSSFSNVDGLVNGADAFEIDAVGVNRPLVGESMTADGVFEPGEVWQFIVDDYTHLAGAPPDLFLSLGVPSGIGISTASIVATEIPTPGSMAILLGAGGVVVTRRRRR